MDLGFKYHEEKLEDGEPMPWRGRVGEQLQHQGFEHRDSNWDMPPVAQPKPRKVQELARPKENQGRRIDLQVQGRAGHRGKVRESVDEELQFNTDNVLKHTYRERSVEIIEGSEEERVTAGEEEKKRGRQLTDNKHGSATDYKR